MGNYPAGIPAPSVYKVHSPLFSPNCHWLGNGSLAEEIEAIKDYSLSVKSGSLKYAPGLNGKKCFHFSGAERLGLNDPTDKGDFQAVEITVAMWYRSPVNASQMPFSISSPTAVDATDNDALNIRITGTAEKSIVALGHDVGVLTNGQRGTDTAILYGDGWNHAIFHRSGTGGTQTFRGYLNGCGAWVAGDSSAITKVVPGANSTPSLGANADGTALFTGHLQSIMVWFRALSDAEMQAVVRSVGLEVMA